MPDLEALRARHAELCAEINDPADEATPEGLRDLARERDRLWYRIEELERDSAH